MARDVDYRMKENWQVKVTAKRGRLKEEPTFKFEFQVSATYTFPEIKGLAETIVRQRLGAYWKVTEVSLEMVGSE